MNPQSSDTVEIFEDDAGEWRWRRVAGNNQVISGSEEGYTRKEDAARAARRANQDVLDDQMSPSTGGTPQEGAPRGYVAPTPPATGPGGGTAGTTPGPAVGPGV